MPSWARSVKSAKSSQASKASDKEPPVKPPSVKSHSSGGEAKKADKTIIDNSDVQFKAALIELLAKVLDKGADDSRGSGSSGYKTKLISIICEKWSGDKKLTARQYRAWKKHIQGIMKYHSLTDTASAFLISLNVTGQAKQALDVFENDDYDNPKILQIMGNSSPEAW